MANCGLLYNVVTAVSIYFSKRRSSKINKRKFLENSQSEIYKLPKYHTTWKTWSRSVFYVEQHFHPPPTDLESKVTLSVSVSPRLTLPPYLFISSCKAENSGQISC